MVCNTRNHINILRLQYWLIGLWQYFIQANKIKKRTAYMFQPVFLKSLFAYLLMQGVVYKVDLPRILSE